MTNQPSFERSQFATKPQWTGAGSPYVVKSHPAPFILNGFVWAVHRETLVKNRLSDAHFFDQERYPFGFNERDWLNRWYRLRIGGESAAHVVHSSFVMHHCLSSWRSFDSK